MGLLPRASGALLITLLFSFAAVAREPTALDRQVLALAHARGLDGTPQTSETIPKPDDPLARLGRALFFSRQLSGDRNVACASCHYPLLAGGDGLSLPVGIGAVHPDLIGPGRLLDIAADGDPRAKTIGGPDVPRNALSTFNTIFYKTALMEDGRVSRLGVSKSGQPIYRTPASTLRSTPDVHAKGDLIAVQARFPVAAFEEMRGYGAFYSMTAPQVREAIARRLRKSGNWLMPFQTAFDKPGMPAEKLITFDNIAAALSAYVRSQTFIDNPWRHFLHGNLTALTSQQKRGALLFFEPKSRGGFGCGACHSGNFFSDDKGHIVGFPQLGRGMRITGEDDGYYLVTQRPADRYKFRTPTLLNVAATGPWGHDGAFDSLPALIRYHANPREGIRHYDFSFRRLPQFADSKSVMYPHARRLTEQTQKHLSPLIVGVTPTSAQTQDIAAFLRALTDPCILSRECMQPWVAGYKDDYDGQLLQAVFGESDADVADSRGDASAARDLVRQRREMNDARVAAFSGPERVPKVNQAQVRGLAACYRYRPKVPASPGKSRFVDVTRRFGFNHRQFIPGRMWYGSKYSYVVELAMETAPMTSGDINGDCWPDFIFGTHDGQHAEAIAYINHGGKRFDKKLLDLKGLPDAIGALGLVDLNGDYRLDLAVGNMYGARETAIYDRTAGGHFKLHQKISMSKDVIGFAFADYNGDGWVDAFASHWDLTARPAFAPALMRNRSGYLLPADQSAGTTGAKLQQNFNFSPGFADFDGDGDMDLVIASDFGTSEVLRNNGNGTFTVVTNRKVITDENGMGSAIGDFNNDGILDWFVTAIYKKNDGTNFNWGKTGDRLYMGTGNGVSFVDRTTHAHVRDDAWGWGTCAADFNNDGWLDLFAENGFGHIPKWAKPYIPGYIYTYLPSGLKDFQHVRPRLFINQGDGTFKDEAKQWGLLEKTNGRGVTCVDYDRDGDIDLVVSQNSAGPRVYENLSRGRNSNSFIGFHLIGKPPNTSAIGAMVTIDAGGRQQIREVLQNSNYQSQDPSTVHFGLGKASRVDEVTVKWPDGRVQRLGPIKANAYYPIVYPGLIKSKSAMAAGPTH